MRISSSSIVGAPVVTLALLNPTYAQEDAAQPTWHADFDVAAAKAKEEGKNLLVDFTGSDWCRWCVQLEKEVLSHKAFWEPVTQDYVLVALDYPRGEEAKAQVPNPERNGVLSAKYRVQGFPTIVLVTPAGHVIGRASYQKGGPEAYVASLGEIATAGKAQLKEALRIVETARGASGDERITAMRTAMDKLKAVGADAPGAIALGEVIKSSLAMEGETPTEALTALIDAGMVDAAVADAAAKIDPTNQQGLLERAVAALYENVGSEAAVKVALTHFAKLHEVGAQDKGTVLPLYINSAEWCERFAEDHDTAVKYAKKAMELGAPESFHAMLNAIINR